MDRQSVIIIGAGSAGLTAAYELAKRGSHPTVVEKSDKVGGLARTETYKGFRFDIGGHRFYTKIQEVQRLWKEMLGSELLTRPRLSRIYYRGRFFNYPIELFNALYNLGVGESLLILMSYLHAQLRPQPKEETFEEWVSNRFGTRLYRTFFKSYTEKVWGIPCNQIQADWAAQRIRGLSLKDALLHAVLGNSNRHSLIKEFYYPARGPGMMWQRFHEKVEELGGKVHLNGEVVSLRQDGAQVRSIIKRDGKGDSEIEGQAFISSMPLPQLIDRLNPPPPQEVQGAASQLRFRALVLVGLIINRSDLFPDNWIYVHDPEVKVGRIQNFKNWSPDMVPHPKMTGLGMEYFCNEGDALWNMADRDLIALAARELAAIGLAKQTEVVDWVVYHQPKAYPVYEPGYREHLAVIRKFLNSIENLQTIGRNGLHRYNNQDHSMLTAMLAVRNLFGEKHDLWSVNTDRSYYEDFSKQVPPD